jgi:hypothetical protein
MTYIYIYYDRGWGGECGGVNEVTFAQFLFLRMMQKHEYTFNLKCVQQTFFIYILLEYNTKVYTSKKILFII